MTENALLRGASSNAQRNHWRTFAYWLIALSLVIRLWWYHVVTTDYTYFVRVWFLALQNHPGLSAFTSPFADYAPLYLYLLKFLTFIPISSLYSSKTVSLIFDIGIAYLGYRTLEKAGLSRDLRFFAAAVFFALPTVMMNSSLWGQSDALYAVCVLAAFYFLLIDTPLASAIAFGLALSLKIQAVFFAPVFIGFMVSRRATWKYLLVPLLVFVLTVIPAWIAGGSFWYWFFIYAKEAGEYPYLSVSAQSIFAFVQPLSLSAFATSILFWIGLLVSAFVGCAIVYFIFKFKSPTITTFTLLSLSSALLLPYLLPRMHERYFYLADIFATLYAFCRRDRIIVPVLVIVASTLAYMPFLSSQVNFLSSFHVDLRIPAALLLIPIGIILWDVWKITRPVFAFENTSSQKFLDASAHTDTR